MEIKFFTEKGVLDLSNQKISFQESNSWLNDKQLTKFTFPFEIFIDDEFLIAFGDYISHESWDLDKEIEGYLLFEGRVHEAKLDIISIEGEYLTGQIDFGFEAIPNHDKKLSELPLEKIKVDDIYTYAIDICNKKYPETNFNFPRIYTKKYSPTEVMWDAFEGYYNHTILENGILRMARNVFPTEENGWIIDNVNIIHPCPHILYLLKAGFQDAGFTLTGDILTDENLQQRWVFSGVQYFRNKWILSQEVLKVGSKQVSRVNGRTTIAIMESRGNFIINKKDRYRLDFSFNLPQLSEAISLKILVNGKTINVPTNKEKDKFAKTAFLEVEYDNTEIEVVFQYERQMRSGTDGGIRGSSSETSPQGAGNISSQSGGFTNAPDDNVPKGDDRYTMIVKTRSQTAYEDSSSDVEEYKVVVNENEIDLTRAVPNITFSELVTIVQNWFNYDLRIVDKSVVMNKIGDKEEIEPKDFRAYEVNKPRRTLLSRKSFLLKFIDLEDYKMDSMYYDRKGAVLNGVPGKETSVIEINGYPMPIGKAKDYHTPTAQVKKDADNVLALVHYDGLVDGINNATNPPGCAFPELFENNWESWLNQRISSEEYNWKFLANISEMSHFLISDYLYCYNKIHIIKDFNKDKIAPNTYEVEITTEAVK